MNAGNRQAALLIDADNLSSGGMEQALAHLHSQGLDICVRRAYGSPETLGAAREFLQHNAVRPIVNQGRGTTDAALVVDAMDLLHAGDLPSLVAIGSADADFAPLVLRLRESGRRVVCFAQAHKASEELGRYYADVIHVDEMAPRKRAAPARSRGVAAARGSSRSVPPVVEPPEAPQPSPAPAPARKAATRKAPARKSAAQEPDLAPPPAPIPRSAREPAPARGSARAPAIESARAPAPAPARAPTRESSRAPATEPARATREPATGERVRAILGSFSGFDEGDTLELNAVVKRLRDEKLMSKSTSVSKFFEQNAPEVELVPRTQPNKLRWRGV